MTSSGKGIRYPLATEFRAYSRGSSPRSRDSSVSIVYCHKKELRESEGSISYDANKTAGRPSDTTDTYGRERQKTEGSIRYDAEQTAGRPSDTTDTYGRERQKTEG